MMKPEASRGGLDDPPAQFGYRMPAEWEPHRATWLSWPHNLDTWPDELAEVEHTMALAAKALATGEAVYINVNNLDQERHVRTVLDEAGVRGEVRFFHIPTNDAWIRDHGAIFVVDDEGGLAATSWRFNSWGEKYPPWDNDNAASDKMAAALGVRTFDGGMILEGGAIDVNGAGVLLTTESCLLNPNRNPSLSKDDIEQRLQSMLGVRQVVWLGDGIVGDDTDGHIDDITRFVGERTIVTAVEADTSDDNYRALQENLERLQALRDDSGRPCEIIHLPMPRPVYIRGERMPASYANFYIGNRVVLMPAYDDPADDVALAILKTCFPDRDIVPISCRTLIWGQGAFHCLTQQVPLAVRTS